MPRLPFFALFSTVLMAGGCMLPHPSEPGDPGLIAPQSQALPTAPRTDPAAVAASPDADAKEKAAIAAALQQVVHAKNDYHLAPADLVSVTVYQDADMNRKVRINTDGTVSLPLIGQVKIGGLSLSAAQAGIEAKLSQYLVSPQVSLFIEEYGNKTIFVMGEVQKPGSYPIPTESRMTLLEAISSAGGFTPIAAQDRARVLRYVDGVSVTYTINTKEITQQGQKDKDMVLAPNDIVYVPQSFF